MCTGDLASPNPHTDPDLATLDGAPGIGICRDGPFLHGQWLCAIRDGNISLRGLIVD
jgi:hypothetical protein